MGRVAHIRAVMRRLFWHTNTDIVHLILASGSLGWAVSLLILSPVAWPPIYRFMFIIPPPIWAALFAVHVVLVNWCLFSTRYSKRCCVFVHSYGVALWLSMTMALNLSANRFSPATSLEWVMCGFALWALFRAKAEK